MIKHSEILGEITVNKNGAFSAMFISDDCNTMQGFNVEFSSIDLAIKHIETHKNKKVTVCIENPARISHARGYASVYTVA